MDFFFLYFYLGESVNMDTLSGPRSKYFYLISECHRCPLPFFHNFFPVIVLGSNKWDN